MRTCPKCSTQTTAPVCPVDHLPTVPLPAPEAGGGAQDDLPDPLLASYRLDVYWGSDESGGMYRGTALATGTTVAIRLVRPDLSANEAYAAAFERQAEQCRGVATHHVAKVLDRGRTLDGRLFLVTEHVRGRSLRHMIDTETLDWLRVREITLQVLTGLAEGHQAGMLHWDLRPEAIWIEDAPRGEPPNVRITGFGLPWWPPRGPGREDGTRSSGYAAPQRFTNSPVDERSDLYALGACLFHVLTRKPPVQRRDAAELARERRADGRPRLARADVPKGIPDGFLELVHRLMAWSPADRPRSAAEVTRLVTSLPEADDPTLGRTTPFGPSPEDAAAAEHAPGLPTGLGAPRPPAPREPPPRIPWAVAAVLAAAVVALLLFFLLSPGSPS